MTTFQLFINYNHNEKKGNKIMLKGILKYSLCFIFGYTSMTTAMSVHSAVTKPTVLNLKLNTQTKFNHHKLQFKERVDFCSEHKQCKTLAEAVFFESRGEPVTGQYAVAFAVMNRRDSWRWPDRIEDVLSQRILGNCQFSYVCELSTYERQTMIAKRQKIWERSLDVAYNAYYYVVHDFTNGADHFYNPDKVASTPKFARVYDFVATIGNHKFYRSTIK